MASFFTAVTHLNEHLSLERGGKKIAAGTHWEGSACIACKRLSAHGMSHNRSPSDVSTGVTNEIKFNLTRPLLDVKNHKSYVPEKGFSFKEYDF